MDDEQKWKRRFYLFMGTRLIGLATFLAGLAIVFTDVLRPGGWPVVGSIVMLLGLLDGVVAPKMMRKQWKRDDEAQ
jgi:hypothetical protein